MYENTKNNNRGKDGRIEVLPVNYSIPTEKLKESYALVDGMNVSLIRKKNQRGRLEDILKVAEMIAESYDHVEIYIDASLRHRIDDLAALDRFIEDGTIFCCPAGITADELIWKRGISIIESGNSVTMVTNDMFPAKKYSPEFKSLKNLTVSIINTGEVYLIERKLERLYGNFKKIMA